MTYHNVVIPFASKEAALIFARRVKDIAPLDVYVQPVEDPTIGINDAEAV